MYTDTLSAIRIDGIISEWFSVDSGVRKGCWMAPDLLLLPVDMMTEETVDEGQPGAHIGSEWSTDLDYADNLALLSETLEILVLSLEIMDQEAHKFGLEMNW